MKKFKKSSIVVALIISFMFIFGFNGPSSVLATTTPYLGTIGSFGVLSSTFTRNIGLTAITGDAGYTTLSGGGTDTVSGTTYVPSPSQAGIDQGSVLSYLNSQSCTFTFTGVLHLDSDTTHGPIGVYTPGVYCSTGAMDIAGGSTITLTGGGTYIFRSAGALDTTASSQVALASGASECDVFWTPIAATTLGANSTFKGTVIDNAGITIGNTVSWIGRALAYGGTVTADTDTIAIPTSCTAAPAPGTGNVDNNTITIFKQVINDNGGTAKYSDFPLFVNGNHVASGQTAFYAPGIYTVTETNLPGYTTTFTGNCDANGQINHGGINTHSDICTVVNNDIGVPAVALVPPLIDVVKTASPLSLPTGSGLVTYTYTLRNIGTVPVTNVTMIGDTCSPIILSSGDTNNDSKLDLNETWIYHCAKTISATHTNTVTATGWANGIDAVDVASATVVVGLPIVPPLIHVVKVPNPLTLPAGAGKVTYRYTVTNPGTAPLSNVYITDDKCTGLPGRVVGHPGDLNGNNLLDSNESWSFTCVSNLTKTTTNTAIAYGTANGLTATDFAIATVVVSVPKLPKTGFPPRNENSMENTLIISGLFIASLSIVLALKKRKI